MDQLSPGTILDQAIIEIIDPDSIWVNTRFDQITAEGFVFTGIGLGLLIGVTLTMAGVYRGMVNDGKVLLDNSGADLWVVQKDILGP